MNNKAKKNEAEILFDCMTDKEKAEAKEINKKCKNYGAIARTDEEKLVREIERNIIVLEHFTNGGNDGLPEEIWEENDQWILDDLAALQELAETTAGVTEQEIKLIEYARQTACDERMDYNEVGCDAIGILKELVDTIREREEKEKTLSLKEMLEGTKGLAEIVKDNFYSDKANKNFLYETVEVINEKLDKSIKMAAEVARNYEFDTCESIWDRLEVVKGGRNYYKIIFNGEENSDASVLNYGSDQEYDLDGEYYWYGSVELADETTFYVKSDKDYHDGKEFIEDVKELIKALKEVGKIDTDRIVFSEAVNVNYN